MRRSPGEFNKVAEVDFELTGGFCERPVIAVKLSVCAVDGPVAMTRGSAEKLIRLPSLRRTIDGC
jgi:hypothetical protein